MNLEQSQLVSVLCTVYNAEQFLEQTIESVLSQTFQQWEMIIVDDASTDRSKVIAQKYDDPRIKVIELPSNVGRTMALNAGLKFCEGEYIAILDADDTARPERLLRQVEFLDSHPDYGVAASWCTIIDELGEQTGTYKPVLVSDDLYQYLGWCDPIIHSSLMWRAAQIHSLGGYGGPPGVEDHSTLIDMTHFARIGIVAEDLVCYRYLTNSLSHSRSKRIVRMQSELSILYKGKQMLSLNPNSLRRNRHARSLLYIRLGLAKIQTGKILEGFLELIKGFSIDPTMLFYPFRTETWDDKWHPQRRFSFPN
jgi:glycosyltransferase involved in cell wall biosynthesis